MKKKSLDNNYKGDVQKINIKQYLNQDVKQDTNPDLSQDVKQDADPDIKQDVNPEDRAKINAEIDLLLQDGNQMFDELSDQLNSITDSIFEGIDLNEIEEQYKDSIFNAVGNNSSESEGLPKAAFMQSLIEKYAKHLK